MIFKPFKNLFAITLAILVGVGLFFAVPAMAQVDLQAFGEAAGFSTGPSIQVIIARLIRTLIGFSGVVVVVFVLYGGFMYMTAGGNADRAEKAKKVLVNATIGLVIVLSAYAITQFLLNSLTKGIAGSSSSSQDGGGGGFYSDGSGGSSLFYLESLNNECAASLQNLKLQFVFSKNVKETTLSSGIAVKKKTGEVVPGTFKAQGKKVIFTPSKLCPKPNASQFCFDPNTDYTVTLGAGLVKSSTGSKLSCTSKYLCSFDFKTGTGVDLKAPQVEMDEPTNGQSLYLGKKELLQAKTKDDVGVSMVDFFVDDSSEPVYTAGLSMSTTKAVTAGADNFFFTDTNSEWDTNGFIPNKSYSVWAVGSDCAGNTVTAKKNTVVLRAASCNNDIQDVDLGETAVDCGGVSSSESYCGSCDGGSCTDSSECSSGQCTDGKCVTTPKIEKVSPGDGAKGNLITISGTGFGDKPGKIRFLGVEGKSVETNAYNCDGTVTWSNKSITVQVPVTAVDGAIEILTEKKETDKTNDEYGPNISNFDVNLVNRPGICSLTPKASVSGKSVDIKGIGMGSSQGTSTIYFGNHTGGKAASWSDTLTKAVVPNLNSGKYYTSLYTGDFVCIDNKGVSTKQICASIEDCKADAGEVCAAAWCSESLKYCDSKTSPCGPDEGQCVSVRSASNTLEFTAQNLVALTKPVVSYVDSGWRACSAGVNVGKLCGTDDDCTGGACQDVPTAGPQGQYVTIFGQDFGSAKGTIKFTNKVKDIFAIGGTDFPKECGENFWSDTAITIKVPVKYEDEGKTAVDFSVHDISVTRQDGQISNIKTFSVVDDSPGPSICSIDPVSGPAGTPIKLLGENLGNKKGTVSFFENKLSDYKIWTDKAIELAPVPDLATTGPVSVYLPDKKRSNPINFAVVDCRDKASLCAAGTQCCGDGSCGESCPDEKQSAHFAYKVSTALIPKNPKVQDLCNDDVKSPSPWVKKDPKVCVNAAVTATFDMDMVTTSYAGNIVVEGCKAPGVTGDCADWEVLASKKTDPFTDGFSWEPAADYKKNTIHRVTLKGGQQADGIKSISGGYLEDDYVWFFNTRDSDEKCEVGSINVNPATHTEKNQDAEIPYFAQPIAKDMECVTLSCEGHTLVWESNNLAATIKTAAPGIGICKNTVVAKEETKVGFDADIKATIDNKQTDFGKLIINFTDPKVTTAFPECTEACVNAMPWFTFNTRMNPATLDTKTVKLFKCKSGLCNPTNLTPVNIVESIAYNKDAQFASVVFKTDGVGDKKVQKTLDADSYYRIWISGDGVESISGKKLSKAGRNFDLKSINNKYYKDDYSYIFKTKESDISCGVDRVSVMPAKATLIKVGDKQEYSAITYGAPDSCSISGQALQNASYTWGPWSSEDDPNKIGGKPALESESVAVMLGSGSLALSKQLPAWCSPSCLNLGSAIKKGTPKCGDGFVEHSDVTGGEECEDGNLKDGDGCSSQCLNEGTKACDKPGDADCCGNNKVDKFEDCDGGPDGNNTCSSSCLNEYSGVLFCGNNKFESDPITGGEDCEDGNEINGDGCSSQCLNEGGVANVYATCGNGGKPEDGEDCDDGNIKDGDGCSSYCLNEGTKACAKAGDTNCCGNKKVEVGEDCDGTQGCSDSCLKLGSSAQNKIPTFCGDKKTEEGEECESVVEDKLKAGGYAVAVIASGAPKEAAAAKPLGYAIAKISAAVEGAPPGIAELKLQCACSDDLSCGNISGAGCGTANCCFDRPNLDKMVPPASKGPGVCKNTAVYVQFDKKMDPKSFGTVDLDGNGKIEGKERIPNIALNLVKGGDGKAINEKTCPAGYQKFANAKSTNKLVSAWGWVKYKVLSFFGRPVSAADYNCIIPYTYTVVATEKGDKVYLNYTTLLEEKSEYTLVVRGDDNESDSVDEGVLSADSVGLCIGDVGCSESQQNKFLVGTEICKIDEVKVSDEGIVDAKEYESSSPNFYSKLEEEHKFITAALTHRKDGSVEEIVSMKGLYEWVWSWGSNKKDKKDGDIVEFTADSKQTDTSVKFVAAGNNGNESVIASATITDSYSDPAKKTELKVSGSDSVTALLCERPWPTGKDFPYKDTVEKTNFSFFYCMDKGEVGSPDDLPELTNVIDVPKTNPNILQELVFNVDGTKDSIGIRVITNQGYLSAADWYNAQNFQGGVSPIELDGYSGVQSGTTKYIAAANASNQTIYPNIYVISYNQDAGPEAIEIFDSILENWKFNANDKVVTDINLCKVPVDGYIKNDDDEFIECSWDGDCVESCVADKCSISGDGCKKDADCDLDTSKVPSCDAEKAKLQRDTERLTNITKLVETLEDYGTRNKHCSVTKGQSCKTSNDCPKPKDGQSENCVSSYPVIQAGSFVPALSTSAWGSWNSVFSNQLGSAVPQDPINRFWKDCSDKEGFDSETCWNGDAGKFECPDRSLVLGYQNKGDESFTVFSQVEYDAATWAFELDKNTKNNANIKVEYSLVQKPAGALKAGFVKSKDPAKPEFCGSPVAFGTSTLCGDGIKGTNNGLKEVCEIGEQDSVVCTNVDGVSGLSTVNCKNDCSGYEDASTGTECVVEFCGDGVVQKGETCDDGKLLNGTYGQCDLKCSYKESFSCGDGYLAGPEQCDCGSELNFADALKDANSWAAIKQCQKSNGQYSAKGPNCTYDCKSPGPSCGDKEINGNETCDGDNPEKSERVEGQTDCGTSRVCTDTGVACSDNNPCAIAGTCSNESYQLKRTRSCGSQTACQWSDWGECLGTNEYCGDGIKNGNEECEDGNDINTDACTNDCKKNFCGDGFVNLAKGDELIPNTNTESCDKGLQNGVECDAEYGDDCTYCNEFCQYKTKSGAYCGNNIIEGKEFCDGTDLPYTCFKKTILSTGKYTLETKGSCKMADEGKLGVAGGYAGCEVGFTCRNVGICNGPGNVNENGESCTPSTVSGNTLINVNYCAGNLSKCIVPTCGLDCGATCPQAFKTTKVSVLSELQGAELNSVIDLYKLQNKEGQSPEVATINIPQCTVGVGLSANINRSNVKVPDVNVVFVTDISTAMDNGTKPIYEDKTIDGKTVSVVVGYDSPPRLQVVKDSTKKAIADLYSMYAGQGGQMNIGLVTFSKTAKVETQVEIGGKKEPGLFDSSHKKDLEDIIDGYKTSSGERSTHSAFTLAIDLLKEKEKKDDVNIVVLLLSEAPTLLPNGEKCRNYNYSEPNYNFYNPLNDCVMNIKGDIEYNESYYPFFRTFSAGIVPKTWSVDQGLAAHMSGEQCGLIDKSVTHYACENKEYDGAGLRDKCYSSSIIMDPKDCTEKTYAFSGTTESEIGSMYTSVVNYISDSVYTIDVSAGSESKAVKAGQNVTLPFPENFRCEDDQKSIPLKNTFLGTGSLNYNNIEFTYCPK